METKIIIFAGELPGPDNVSMACFISEILREYNLKTYDSSRHIPVCIFQNVSAWFLVSELMTKSVLED